METETRNGTWPLNTQSCHDCRLQGAYSAYVLLPVPFSCGNIRYERAFLCPDCAAARAAQDYYTVYYAGVWLQELEAAVLKLVNPPGDEETPHA